MESFGCLGSTRLIDYMRLIAPLFELKWLLWSLSQSSHFWVRYFICFDVFYMSRWIYVFCVCGLQFGLMFEWTDSLSYSTVLSCIQCRRWRCTTTFHLLAILSIQLESWCYKLGNKVFKYTIVVNCKSFLHSLTIAISPSVALHGCVVPYPCKHLGSLPQCKHGKVNTKGLLPEETKHPYEDSFLVKVTYNNNNKYIEAFRYHYHAIHIPERCLKWPSTIMFLFLHLHV